MHAWSGRCVGPTCRHEELGGFLFTWQDLVEGVLALLGLKADAVGDNESLALLGIDSMQLMEAGPVSALLCLLRLPLCCMQQACSFARGSSLTREVSSATITCDMFGPCLPLGTTAHCLCQQ